MMTENDVIQAVCSKLIDMNFVIKQSLHTTEKGVDIIANKEGFTLFIEAKGETSALTTSSRFGRPFNQSQIKNHIGKALLATLKAISESKDRNGVGFAIALPDNKGHRKVVDDIEYALKKLNVYVFWVRDKSNVEINFNKTGE